MLNSIDINCDLGESFANWKMGNDAEVIPQITTANIACGFHAGDPATMVETVREATRHDVPVGALILGFRICLASADARCASRRKTPTRTFSTRPVRYRAF